MSDTHNWIEGTGKYPPSPAPESTPPEDPVSSLQKVAWRLEQIADTFDALAEKLRDLAALMME